MTLLFAGCARSPHDNSRPLADRRGRPFYQALRPSSQYQAVAFINAMFAWLVQAAYLAGNPLSPARQRTRRAKPRITRYLDRELWHEVKLHIDSLPKDTPRERERYLRARWLFTMLSLGGLRISEVDGNTMGCFFCRHDADGQERWWLEVLGKGGKEGLVPAPRGNDGGTGAILARGQPVCPALTA